MIYIVSSVKLNFKRLTTPLPQDHALYMDNGKFTAINIQDAIKDFLRTKKRNESTLKINEHMTIYHKNPPKLKESDVVWIYPYTVNNNGALPTIVNPMTCVKLSRPSIQTTKYGDCWLNHTFLSPKRREIVEAKREETRLNRRHIGDCPSPT